VAPELDRAVRQLVGSVGKLGCVAVKRDGAVREVVLSVARGCGRQRGGQLGGPRGEFLGAVVDLVHAWGGLDVDIRFYFHGAGCQFAGTVLEFVRPGGAFLADACTDLFRTCGAFARAGIGPAGAAGEYSGAFLQMLRAGGRLAGPVLELGRTVRDAAGDQGVEPSRAMRSRAGTGCLPARPR
jgi:hypothetical protein